MNFPVLPVSREELASLTQLCMERSNSAGSADMLKLAFSCIDLTTLNATDTISHVAIFTQKVNHFELEYPTLGHVGAICVYPNMVSTVKENLGVEGVNIAAVAGGFPSSMTFESIKMEEARLAVIAGADEIDIVLPLWAFLEGNFEACRREISSVKKSIGDAHLKVILETGALTDPEKIWQASVLALESGADFIKTSTGKMAVSATPEAAVIMCLALKYWYEKTGDKRGFKPAGGIAKTHEAMIYLSIVKEILGDEWLHPSLFRIGASRLANDLLSGILGKPATHF